MEEGIFERKMVKYEENAGVKENIRIH